MPDPAASAFPRAGGEVQLEGLPGPTHHYGGLSPGNVASSRNRGRVSRPREAALQALAKMRWLQARGVPFLILPPLPRPDVGFLSALGFTGNLEETLRGAHQQAPALLARAASASSMWVANAATVGASADTVDRRLRFLPANLATWQHRALEARETARLLGRIFPSGPRVRHLEPLPSHRDLGDEGAANHLRLSLGAAQPGWNAFIHAPDADSAGGASRRFVARQTEAASRAAARALGLRKDRTFFLAQSALAIDAGAFHNDVVAMGAENRLVAHESAFAGGPTALKRLETAFRRETGTDLRVRWVTRRELSLRAAVRTYFFNSQWVRLGDGRLWVLAPGEAAEDRASRRLLDRLRDDGFCDGWTAFDLRQSMRNGGGPACLRLRVPMTAAEWRSIPDRVKPGAARLRRLEAFVRTRYPETLRPADLADAERMRKALAIQRGVEKLLLG